MFHHSPSSALLDSVPSVFRPALFALGLGALALASCKKPSSEKATSPSASASGAASTSASAKAASPSVQRPADAIAEPGPGIIALSADETHLFWVSSGYEGSPKGVFSLPKTGGSATRLVDVDQAIGVWATKEHLYYGDAGPELLTLPKSGGRPESVVRSEALITTATAADGHTLCWIGAPAAEVAPAPSAPAARAKRALAPSATAQHRPVLDSDRRTLFCRSDGATQNVPAAAVTIFSGPIAVSGDHVFWATPTDALIEAAPVAGGAARLVARGESVTALAANKSSLYFIGTHHGEKALFVVPKQGGTPKKLASIAQSPRFLVVDEADAYYAIKGGLWRVPLTGGSPTSLLGDDVTAVKGLVVDGSNVFLASGPFVRQVKKTAP